MAELKIQVPNEIEREVKEFNLDVSKVVIESIKGELTRYVALKMIASKSHLTEEDAIELGRKIKKGRFEKLKKEGYL
mgnify:CR=1 FL=1